MNDLARLIRAEARRRGMRSGVDRNRIWLWEQGGTTPNEESQLLLAAVLDVPAVTVGSVGWPTWLPVFEEPAPFSPLGSRAA
jgi:transcriptional regulator with XRE-family HTH domain